MRETTCRCVSLVAHSGGGVESRHEISGVLHSRHEIIVKTVRSQQVLEEQWQQSVEYHWSDVAAAGCCCVCIYMYMKKERLYQMPVCNDSGCIRAHTPPHPPSMQQCIIVSDGSGPFVCWSLTVLCRSDLEMTIRTVWNFHDLFSPSRLKMTA